MRSILMAVLLGSVCAASTAPAESELIEVRKDEMLRVAVSGRGPLLVLIPGLMGSAYGFRRRVGPLQEAGFRVAVVEPLGIGGSTRPREADYSLTAQADRVDAVLRDLDGGPAEAAGTKGFRRAMRFAPLLRLFGGTGRVREQVRSTLRSRSADPRWVTEEVVSGYMEGPSRDLGATLRAYGRMASAREPELLVPHLPSIRCPVRLVIGTATREGGISEAEVEQLKQSLPFFAVETVPDAGHFVFEEQPLTVVAAVERTVMSPARVARSLR
jgi:pimeloyl-ACP methyl ester carboxylesterase